jgi:hypothetical protein
MSLSKMINFFNFICLLIKYHINKYKDANTKDA